MAQHRHLTCVRSDGLSTVLRPLSDDRRIVAATLVDVGSGLLLDGYADDRALADLELLGATHADLVRSAAAVTRGEVTELTVGTGDGRHHLLHAVPDPHGDRLVLTVVVAGGLWAVERVRRRLRAVPVEALTAGPTLQRRPVGGRWFPEPAPPTDPIPACADVEPQDEPEHEGAQDVSGASTDGTDGAAGAGWDASIPAARDADDSATPAVPAAPAPPSAMVPRVSAT